MRTFKSVLVVEVPDNDETVSTTTVGEVMDVFMQLTQNAVNKEYTEGQIAVRVQGTWHEVQPDNPSPIGTAAKPDDMPNVLWQFLRWLDKQDSEEVHDYLDGTPEAVTKLIEANWLGKGIR